MTAEGYEASFGGDKNVLRLIVLVAMQLHECTQVCRIVCFR